MNDPFLIEGPACVSFSGGRTSGYMLRRILDAHGGTLPVDVHVLFANTGKERPETLDFVHAIETRWGVRVRWLEYDGGPMTWAARRAAFACLGAACGLGVDACLRLALTVPSDGPRFREVTYATADREGGPFDDLIDERSYLPNPVTRICTEVLKVKTMKRFLLAQGHAAWTSCVGLRRDEPERVARLRAADRERETIRLPLDDAGDTLADVRAFWAAQPFDLALKPWEGNCDLCFLKGRAKKQRVMRERPDLSPWWERAEARVGAGFRIHSLGYAAMAEHVRRNPLLPIFDADPVCDLDDLGDCVCTD